MQTSGALAVLGWLIAMTSFFIFAHVASYVCCAGAVHIHPEADKMSVKPNRDATACMVNVPTKVHLFKEDYHQRVYLPDCKIRPTQNQIRER